MTTNLKKIYDYLKSAGLTDEGALGLIGNLYAESGLKPENVQNSYEKKIGMSDWEYVEAVDNGTYSGDDFIDGIGFGIAQWTFSTRKAALYEYIKAKNLSIASLEGQLGFLIYELGTSYPSLLGLLKTTHSIKEASDAVLTKFERPTDMSESNKDRRAQIGETLAKELSIGMDVKTNVKDPIETVVSLAESQVGYQEKASNYQLDDFTANAGTNNWTKYARDLDGIGNIQNGKKNSQDWCDVFVDWLFIITFGADIGHRMIYQDLKGLGAGVGYSARYYKNNNAYYTKDPHIGDQIFFGDMDHTGIVVELDGDYVITVEGNYGNKVGKRRIRKNDSFITGYGRPNWSLAGSVKPQPSPTPEPKPTPTTQDNTEVYTVVSGDTLSKIAAKYNTTVSELVKLNNISNPNLIYVGQKIILKAKTTETPKPVEQPIVEKPVEPVVEKPVEKPTATVEEEIYVVKAGDTLSKIAEKYGTTWKALAEYNKIENPNIIFVNQKIAIPLKGKAVEVQKPVEQVKPKQPVTYKVVAGDTLWDIAKKYNTTVAELVRINDIKNANLIYVGQVLKIN